MPKVEERLIKGLFGRAHHKGSKSCFGEAIICGFAKTALAPLLYIKNGFYRKTFGRASLEEPELERRGALPNRS